jgi:hypothetical protein
MYPTEAWVWPAQFSTLIILVRALDLRPVSFSWRLRSKTRYKDIIIVQRTVATPWTTLATISVLLSNRAASVGDTMVLSITALIRNAEKIGRILMESRNFLMALTGKSQKATEGKRSD